MQHRFNNPNWFQSVTVYRPGSSRVISSFDIEQVWDGSIEGHRRLRRLCVEQIEKLRDAHGLHYILWSPVMHGGRAVPLVDRGLVTVE